MNWTLRKPGFSPDDIPDNGNRFLTGNGYMGVRGTLDEYTQKELTAINLAGLYDQVGDGWREPLNAPNPLYTRLFWHGQLLGLPDIRPVAHEQAVDFRSGLVSRSTTFSLPDGHVTISSQRFVVMDLRPASDRRHLLGLRYTITLEGRKKPEAFILRAGVDGQVWDLHGPHYACFTANAEDGILCVSGHVQNGRDTVASARKNWFSFPGAVETSDTSADQVYTFSLAPGQSITLTSLCSIFTSRDTHKPEEAAISQLRPLKVGDYLRLQDQSAAAWEAIWSTSEVSVTLRQDQMAPDEEDPAEAINYSLYHLNCIAPREGTALSIPARGLSGQTYKGAVFWDTEMFMLDYFLFTQPEVARSLVLYRIETLSGALDKAREYGLEGAFYAWESQEGGRDACSDYNITDVFTGRPVRTYFKDKQIHISAAVVWGILRYVKVTGDTVLLRQGGARTVLECARFYLSVLLRPFGRERWELRDVIGPDEYHERVNNNAYTNRMAAFTFDSALQAAELLQQEAPEVYTSLRETMDLDHLLAELRRVRRLLYIPSPNSQKLIPQFDGYFSLRDATPGILRPLLKDPREYWGGGHGVASDTQVIKQADVVAMLELFHEEYSPDILQANWEYYEPRTEHGSSLSSCMYAMLACRFGRADLAYPYFLKSACAEIRGGGKQWAGLVYIGGTHPAAAGGAWKVMALAFAGLHLENGSPVLSPCLPPQWESLTFRFVYNRTVYEARVNRQGTVCLPIREASSPEEAVGLG